MSKEDKTQSLFIEITNKYQKKIDELLLNNKEKNGTVSF